MKEKSTNRIFGFDIMRSIAIILVVIGHSDFRYIDHIHSVPLPDGVDLFFVLSGFLIGTILIRTAEENQRFNLKVILNFLQRRWFRTLPNYFLFLLINIILIYFGFISGFLNKYLSTFFVFFQNFHKPYDFLFWESWSLSVEEWFYLLFPFVVLFLFSISNYRLKVKYIIVTAIAFFLIFPLLYRIIQFELHPFLSFDLYFRKLVLTRLDTIGFGLLGAYIHWYHNDFWKKSKNIFFILGLIALIFLTTVTKQDMLFLKTYYFSLIGLSILLLLPKIESIKNEKIPFKPFQFVSKISYSMYLIHLPLIQITSKVFSFSNKYEAILIYIIFWIFLLLLSYLVYRFYERPLMNLRDSSRITKFFKNERT